MCYDYACRKISHHPSAHLARMSYDGIHRTHKDDSLIYEIDTHVTIIVFIEGGTKFVRLSTLRKLAQALGVEIKELFDGVK